MIQCLVIRDTGYTHEFKTLVDALHSQIKRFSGRVAILLPVRFSGVAQVATPTSVTVCRKAGSQESSQSQLKGLP